MLRKRITRRSSGQTRRCLTHSRIRSKMLILTIRRQQHVRKCIQRPLNTGNILVYHSQVHSTLKLIIRSSNGRMITIKRTITSQLISRSTRFSRYSPKWRGDQKGYPQRLRTFLARGRLPCVVCYLGVRKDSGHFQASTRSRNPFIGS